MKKLIGALHSLIVIGLFGLFIASLCGIVDINLRISAGLFFLIVFLCMIPSGFNASKLINGIILVLAGCLSGFISVILIAPVLYPELGWNISFTVFDNMSYRAMVTLLCSPLLIMASGGVVYVVLKRIRCKEKITAVCVAVHESKDSHNNTAARGNYNIFTYSHDFEFDYEGKTVRLKDAYVIQHKTNVSYKQRILNPGEKRQFLINPLNPAEYMDLKISGREWMIMVVSSAVLLVTVGLLVF